MLMPLCSSMSQQSMHLKDVSCPKVASNKINLSPLKGNKDAIAMEE